MDNPIREVRLGSKHARGDYFAFMNTIFEDKKITWAQLTLVSIYYLISLNFLEIFLKSCLITWNMQINVILCDVMSRKIRILWGLLQAPL